VRESSLRASEGHHRVVQRDRGRALAAQGAVARECHLLRRDRPRFPLGDCWPENDRAAARTIREDRRQRRKVRIMDEPAFGELNAGISETTASVTSSTV